MLTTLPCGCIMKTLGTYDLDHIERLLNEGHSIIIDNPNQEEIALFYLDEQDHTIKTMAMSDWTTDDIATEVLNYENTIKKTFPYYKLKRHRFSFAKVRIHVNGNGDGVEFECEAHAV